MVGGELMGREGFQHLLSTAASAVNQNSKFKEC